MKHWHTADRRRHISQSCANSRDASHLALLAGMAMAWGLMGVSNLRTQASAPTEYQVKATFLYNFAKYVEWPATSFTASDEFFNVCVLGEDPFGRVLDDTIEGEAINSRKLVVRRLSRVNDSLKCQILFVSSSEEGRLGQILMALDGKSVMTVGDIPRFAERGGMIHFRLEGTKVRFDINADAAQRAALTMSSQLLKLARIVRGNSQRGG